MISICHEVNLIFHVKAEQKSKNKHTKKKHETHVLNPNSSLIFMASRKSLRLFLLKDTRFLALVDA